MAWTSASTMAEVLRAGRSVRLRQINATAHGRRAGDFPGGTVAIGERAVNAAAERARCGDGVPELRAVSHMTVRDNMGFSLMLAKRPSAEIAERVNQAAEILGLTPYLDRLPKRLGGQRQR